MHHNGTMILIITAHPDAESFSAAITKTVADSLKTAGIETHISDLYRLADGVVFPALLDAEELKRKTSLDPLVQQQMKLVEEANGFIVIHPDWWGGPPAILKGWIDRVLRPGTAYETPEGFGPRDPTGLLNEKKAMVIISGDTRTPGPLKEFWIERVWGFCGAETQLLYLPEIRESRLSDRETFRKNAGNEAVQLFRS